MSDMFYTPIKSRIRRSALCFPTLEDTEVGSRNNTAMREMTCALNRCPNFDVNVLSLSHGPSKPDLRGYGV